MITRWIPAVGKLWAFVLFLANIVFGLLVLYGHRCSKSPRGASPRVELQAQADSRPGCENHRLTIYHQSARDGSS